MAIHPSQNLSVICENVVMKGIDREGGESPVQMGCAAILPKGPATAQAWGPIEMADKCLEINWLIKISCRISRYKDAAI